MIPLTAGSAQAAGELARPFSFKNPDDVDAALAMRLASLVPGNRAGNQARCPASARFAAVVCLSLKSLAFPSSGGTAT